MSAANEPGTASPEEMTPAQPYSTRKMKPFFSRSCFFAAVLFLSASLPASEPDWPSPDDLMRSTITVAVQTNPDTGRERIERLIQKKTREDTGPGDYKRMLDDLERKNRVQPYGTLLDEVFPIVLESFDLDAYRRLVKLAPEHNRGDACRRIMQFCFDRGRLMDESFRLPDELDENRSGPKRSRKKTIPVIVLARECSKIEADGSVSPAAQRSVFRKFNEYARRGERFLVTEWLGAWVSASQRKKLFEAIKSTKAGKDEKAKALFEQVFDAIPNHGAPPISGAVNPSDDLCAIALIQIELGKTDWARELIPRIIIPEREDYLQRYALSLRLKIADLQFMLGEPAAARRTIEELGEPVVPRVWCDLAVALFEHGDADGAKEVLETVLDALEKGAYARERDIDALLEACAEIEDKKWTDDTIRRVLQIAEPKTNVYRNECRRAVLNALIRLQRFDEAKELSKDEGMTPSAKDIVEALLEAKRYDEVEEYIATLRWVEVPVEAMRKIAKIRFDAGDVDGARDALHKALKFAHADFGWSYKPVFDVAWDATKYRRSEMKQSVSEIAEEVFRFHRELLTKVRNDATEFSEEELRHLLHIVGRAKHNDYPDYGLVRDRLRSLVPTIYQVIVSTAFDTPNGLASAYILELIEVDY